MFADLTDKAIQPRNIDVEHLPEIRISDKLKADINKMLIDEEGGYVHVLERTAIVQTDKNYVFIPFQWLYLAVLCKKYAEALYPYGDFFDLHIRGDQEMMKAFLSRDVESPILRQLILDDMDREKMVKYVMADSNFRPGKELINKKDDGIAISRSTRDIFGSCILKKLAVPDASSAYLGSLIYYLAGRPPLFNELESEIGMQLDIVSSSQSLPDKGRNCAKAIVDYIYTLDKFARIAHLFVVKSNIRIDSADIPDILPQGSWLPYLFLLPGSDMLSDSKARAFDDIYEIHLNDANYHCRLTNDWTIKDFSEKNNTNYLLALIRIVNHYYADMLEIKQDGAGWVLCRKQEFTQVIMPEVFDTRFTRRYITSLLAKPFVILTGNSGTGKTRIAKQFAEYMEVIDEAGEKNWLIVPVGADWTDNTKVLGFYNPLANDGKGNYEKTQIIKLIERANAHKSTPYFLILDEMNLSHVERYFSDFLSHMEIPDDPFELDGYGKDAGSEHGDKLPYPDNLFVTGTVNIDETTYMFSPKVLDRANVVEFKPAEDDVLKLFGEEMKLPAVSAAPAGVATSFLRLSKAVRNGEHSLDSTEMEKARDIFEKIYKTTEPSGFEFAYRTVSEIKRYLAAAHKLNNAIEIEKLVDEQVLQKILPKIHGNRKEIGDMLVALKDICDEHNLELSGSKIQKMMNKLDNVQYASFI